MRDQLRVALANRTRLVAVRTFARRFRLRGVFREPPVTRRQLREIAFVEMFVMRDFGGTRIHYRATMDGRNRILRDKTRERKSRAEHLPAKIFSRRWFLLRSKHQRAIPESPPRSYREGKRQGENEIHATRISRATNATSTRSFRESEVVALRDPSLLRRRLFPRSVTDCDSF